MINLLINQNILKYLSILACTLYREIKDLDNSILMKDEVKVQCTSPTCPLTGDHVARMHSIPGNSTCADCAAHDPEWACIDHGTTICIDCSGVHRSMGVNVSKVRSLLLDNWTEDIITVSFIFAEMFNLN